MLTVLRDDRVSDELLPTIMLLISNYIQLTLPDCLEVRIAYSRVQSTNLVKSIKEISNFVLSTLVTEKQYLTITGKSKIA